ncbi:MAG: hypothetical protein ACRC2S_16550 [Waterburya sp.]
MNLTINPEIYANLLAEYQPKVIKIDRENERAIAAMAIQNSGSYFNYSSLFP